MPTKLILTQQTTADGYATDLITDLCLDWLGARDRDRPFFLMCHHKAPHRPFAPAPRHARRDLRGLFAQRYLFQSPAIARGMWLRRIQMPSLGQRKSVSLQLAAGAAPHQARATRDRRGATRGR